MPARVSQKSSQHVNGLLEVEMVKRRTDRVKTAVNTQLRSGTLLRLCPFPDPTWRWHWRRQWAELSRERITQNRKYCQSKRCCNISSKIYSSTVLFILCGYEAARDTTNINQWKEGLYWISKYSGGTCLHDLHNRPQDPPLANSTRFSIHSFSIYPIYIWFD